VLTAAHVVVDAPAATVLDRKVEITWANQAYDVALLAVPGEPLPGARELSCRKLVEAVTVSGFAKTTPLPLTTRGVVSGQPYRFNDEIWRDVAVMDTVVASGASGAGVIDSFAKVVGIAVGLLGDWIMQPHNRRAFLSDGYSVFVPSSAICRLMGIGG
jgi:hypothetical protein